MPLIQPFAGWRYDPGKVDYAKVATPPYDVIDAAQQTALYQRDDRNLIRLILGREFPTDTDADNRYSRAAAHLDAWRAEGLFVGDQPAIYVYQMDFTLGEETVSQRGFFARVLLSDWSTGGIYPHEKTLSGPKADRLKLMRATRGNLEPVFGLLTDPTGGVSQSLYQMCDYDTAADFTDGDGVRHRLWVLDSPAAAEFCRGCGREHIFIADGHHRYETALNYRNEVRDAMRRAGQPVGEFGALAEDYIMMYIAPDSDPGLAIFPTHRLLYGVAGLDTLLKRLTTNFTVAKVADLTALRKKMSEHLAPAFGWITGAGMYFVGLDDDAVMNTRAADAVPAWRKLDVAVLHLLILDDLLGIDEDKLARKENLFYTHSAEDALNAVKTKRDGIQGAFLLRPTTMEQVRQVSRAGATMPQKSTYFYPKVASGMVLNFFW
ncbi:MAG: DUF1015 domain-containing protein [Planctomycetota bacterium]|nr:DUF1015 domain-containing protein [Planctomycetota bacterium]